MQILGPIIVCTLAIIPYVKSSEDRYENSTNICERCECTMTVEVFTLNCVGRGIRNTLSNWPPNHVNKILKSTFSLNNITTLEAFPATDSITDIVLSRCGIRYLEAGLFENAKKIRYVDLSYNLLTTEQLSAEKFKGPFNLTKFEPIELEVLNLGYNQIHSLSQKIFEHTPNLKSLNLEGNNFKVLDEHTQMALSSILNIIYLNLGNNDLTEIPEDPLRNYKYITEINLGYNDLDFVPHSLRIIGPSLQKLTLDDNPIIEIDNNSFIDLSSILELSISNLSKLKLIPANTFIPLSKLEKLKMYNNPQLNTIDKEAFEINKTLKELYLYNNSFQDIPYKLIDWSSLKVFEFHENPLICSCNLYRIYKELNEKIRTRKGVECFGENQVSKELESLEGDICETVHTIHPGFFHHADKSFTILRISLITTSVVLFLVAGVVLSVAFIKHRKYGAIAKSFRDSTVVYNRLNQRTAYT